MEAAIQRISAKTCFANSATSSLNATMVIVGGGLAVAGVAAAATGVGLVIEGVAAVGAALLVAGAAMSGWQIGEGLNALYDFFQETRCDRAQTPQQIHEAGKKFGTGIAKVGVGTVNLLLAMLGGRGKNWRGKPTGLRPDLVQHVSGTKGRTNHPRSGPTRWQSVGGHRNKWMRRLRAVSSIRHPIRSTLRTRLRDTFIRPQANLLW